MTVTTAFICHHCLEWHPGYMAREERRCLEGTQLPSLRDGFNVDRKTAHPVGDGSLERGESHV